MSALQAGNGQCLHWAEHAATLQSFLGSPGQTLMNGTSTWDENAVAAANEWNAVGADFTFTVTAGGQFTDPCGPQGTNNVCGNPSGSNPIYFANSRCGVGFGDALELTLGCWVADSGALLNAAVFVNNTVEWNAYDGPLQTSNGQYVYDIRRLLLHELGHVLGLDHPDAHGQSVAAIMNSHARDLFRLQPDDIEGIFSLYGGSPPPPACAGDCDGNSAVQIDEIITLINIVLGSVPLSACAAGDLDHSGDITIDEVIAAVHLALSNCPVPSSPQVTGMIFANPGINAMTTMRRQRCRPQQRSRSEMKTLCASLRKTSVWRYGCRARRWSPRCSR